jgi:hypothetical protein
MEEDNIYNGYMTDNYYWGITTTTTTNRITNIDWTGTNSEYPKIIEYIDIFYQFMEIDMDYERFSKMSKDEKKVFIRELKLKKLIDMS